MIKYDRAPVSNAQRQREFRARNPGYRNKYRSRDIPANVPPMVPPAPVENVEAKEARPEPTDVRPEPTLFDPFPPFELKTEEKPIDLHLAGLAM